MSRLQTRLPAGQTQWRIGIVVTLVLFVVTPSAVAQFKYVYEWRCS